MKKQIEEKQFDEEVLSIDRVTRVVAGGRRLRFRAVVIVGDRKGRIGLGTGKANEVNVSVQKATRKAKKNMIRVPIFNDTIAHDIKIKFKSSRLWLSPAGAGTGIIAGSVIRKILALAGYKNILSKMFGSSNKLVNAQTTFMALGRLKERKMKEQPAKELPKEKVSDKAPESTEKKPEHTEKKAA